MVFRCSQADLFTFCSPFGNALMRNCEFLWEYFLLDIGLRIYAKFYTIEELVALSEMPSTSSYGWTKVLREPLLFWHRIKNLRKILHNWRVGSTLRDAFCVELWLNKGIKKRKRMKQWRKPRLERTPSPAINRKFIRIPSIWYSM